MRPSLFLALDRSSIRSSNMSYRSMQRNNNLQTETNEDVSYSRPMKKSESKEGIMGKEFHLLKIISLLKNLFFKKLHRNQRDLQIAQLMIKIIVH